jgi:hypothetical protein
MKMILIPVAAYLLVLLAIGLGLLIATAYSEEPRFCSVGQP